MKIKLATTDLDAQNAAEKFIDEKAIEAQVAEKGSVIFYLDKENSLKDMQKLKANLEKTMSVHWNEIRYGLDKDSFLYELHLISK